MPNLPATCRSAPLAEKQFAADAASMSDAGSSIHCADTPAVHFATNAWQAPLDVSTALLKPRVSARGNPPGANTAPNKVQDDGKNKNADDRDERLRFRSQGLHSEHKKDHNREQDAGQQ